MCSTKNGSSACDVHRIKGLRSLSLVCGDIMNTTLTKNLSFSDDGRVYCNATLDPFSCWPATPGGHYAVISCPEVPGVDATSMVIETVIHIFKGGMGHLLISLLIKVHFNLNTFTD